MAKGELTFVSEDGSLTVYVGQTSFNGTLRWYESGRKEGGPAFEADGIGFPPEEIRRQLIEENGEWGVVADESVNKTAVVRAIRAILEIDMAAAGKILKSLPGVIFTGTEVEAGWLKMKLQKSGVAVELLRLR